MTEIWRQREGVSGQIGITIQKYKGRKYLGMFDNSELFCVLKDQVPRERQLGDEQKR